MLFHIFNNNASWLALPRISQRGEEEQYTSAGFSSEMETLQRQPLYHCWTTICVSEARKSSHTLCLPDAWLVSSGLPVTPGFLVSFSSLFVKSSIHDWGKMPCYSFSKIWISLLLAILLGCPIHENLATSVSVGDFHGKVQGTFFLLGLCLSCDSAIFRGRSSSYYTIMACVCGSEDAKSSPNFVDIH